MRISSLRMKTNDEELSTPFHTPKPPCLKARGGRIPLASRITRPEIEPSRYFVGPLERYRGSVGPSWHFLCVAREAFPILGTLRLTATRDVEPSIGAVMEKESFQTPTSIRRGPRGVLEGVLDPFGTPVWSRNGSPEGSPRGPGGVSEQSWFGVPF